MHFSTARSSCALLLFILVARDGAQGQLRISQTKCQEYRQWTESNRINCNRPASLILSDHVREGEFPHYALFGWKSDDNPSSTYEFLSSGSLISERFILTAAHSTQYQQKPPVVARLGEVDSNGEVNRHVDYEIAEVIRHPNFTARSAYYDIALVRLKEPVSFSENIRPACLWDSMQMNFTSVIATGFTLADHDLASGKLQKFNLNVMNTSVCESLYGSSRSLRYGVTDRQLCFAGSEHGYDSCQGDSGAPAQVTPNPEDCMAYVVGVGSYGSRCGGGLPMEIYTKVASYIDWIEGIVWS